MFATYIGHTKYDINFDQEYFKKVIQYCKIWQFIQFRHHLDNLRYILNCEARSKE